MNGTNPNEGAPQAPDMSGSTGADQPQAPEAVDWTPYLDKEIDIPGYKKMPLGKLLESHKELNDTFLTKNQEHSKQVQQFKDQYSWADDFANRYYSDPNFRAWYDSGPTSGYDSGTNYSMQDNLPKAPDPQLQALMKKVSHMEQKDADREIGQAFDRIRAQDYPLDKEMEMQVLEEATTSGIHDVTAVYWKLFADKAVKHKAEAASKKTAEKMNANNNTYERLPSQSVSTSAPSGDVSKMDDGEWRSAALSRMKSIGRLV